MIEDFLSSGILEAASGHRFIAFDRPGFGYSERPRGRSWGPFEQAGLLRQALARLEIERPIIVGHSWGALVALAMALDRPLDVMGLVLVAGYYYPMAPSHAPTPASIALPLAGELLRQTAVRFARRVMAPGTMRRVFAPCPVPERFMRAYPLPLAMRTSQMQAVDEEAAMLRRAATSLSRLYGQLSVPVHLIAGTRDRIVDTTAHSIRLYQELPGASLDLVPDCGHMVHHAAPAKVAAAIAGVGRERGWRAQRPVPSQDAPQRHWLDLNENLVAA
jgi:pimeloyl-ACP methyl ester carboxylesterase